MRQNRRVTTPETSARPSMAGVVGVWVTAAVIAVLVGILAPDDWRAAWMGVGMGLVIPIAFAVQLWSGRSHGFIQRMALSVLGALLVMGCIGVGLGLATLFSA